MFGASEKKSRGLAADGEFLKHVQVSLVDLLNNDQEIQRAVDEKFDAVISSTTVMDKIFNEIEGIISIDGKRFISTHAGLILNSAEFVSDVQNSIAKLLRTTLEKSGNKSFIDYLNEPTTKAEIRSEVLDRVNALFADRVFSEAVEESTKKLVSGYSDKLATESVRASIHRRDIQQELEATARKLIAEEIDLNFPRIFKVERPDGSHSKAARRHSQFEGVLKAAAVKGANIMLVGPAGSGKTKIAMEVADALGQQFYFNGPVQSEYKLLGFRDAQGNYNRTPFYNAYTEGGVYLFDEIDASSPQALVAFNTAIANGYCDFPSHDHPVKMSPGFLCMAAANTYGRGANHLYVGRNQLDAATLDRFIVIEINYDEDMERHLAEDLDWVKKIQHWRKRASELEVRHVISMRASIMGARLLKNNVPENDVEEMVVWRGLDPSTVSKIKAT